MTKIKALQIDWFNEADYKQFRDVASEEKRRRIDKFMYIEDYKRSLLGDALARKMISNVSEIPMDTIIFNVNGYGKPCVVNVSDIYFNVSHSGKWVSCIVSDKQCGIDVEKIANIDMGIAERFFAKSEYNSIKERKDVVQRQKFFEYWTIKESYIKFVGKGLSIPLNSFEVYEEANRYMIKPYREITCNVEVIDFNLEYKMAISYLDKQYEFDINPFVMHC